jgi:hypothetical protein
MLSLPQGWQSLSAGALARRLYGQVSQGALRHEVARRLIGACVRLAVERSEARTGNRLVAVSLPDFRWQIADYSYVYFPEVNDDALGRAIKLRSPAFFGVVLVPPNHEAIMRHACGAALRAHAPTVLSLDGLVDFRALFASIDFEWPHARVLIEMLRRYNTDPLNLTSDMEALVELPSGDWRVDG